MSKIYLPNGYVNCEWLYDQCRGFLDITGGRATGKTFGMLSEVIKRGDRFIYLRRLQTHIDMCGDERGNPFKKVNNYHGWNIQPFKKRGLVRFHEAEIDESGKNVPVGEPLGYAMALSTVATIRGVDFSDVDVIIFDEFIRDSQERSLNNEFGLFQNFIETVGRNRELESKQPLKVIMLANANRLANPYYTAWGFMRTALRMIAGGQQMYRSPDGSRISVLLLDSPISAAKAKTTLYRNASKDFIRTALENAFRTDETNIKSWKLRECNHIVSIGDIGIYRHKGDGLHYVSGTACRDNHYDDYGIHLKKFKMDYIFLKTIYLCNSMFFENYEVELIFREYFELLD